MDHSTKVGINMKKNKSNATHSNTNPQFGLYLMQAHSHITQAVAAMDSCFSIVRPHQHGIAVGQEIGLKAMPCCQGLTTPKQLSMAAITRVIWLCACARYWPDRGFMFECVTCFCFLFINVKAVVWLGITVLT